MMDVVIVGGGVAGLSAALYTAGAGLSTLVFDTGNSQIKKVSSVMNYPGFTEGISGDELIEKMRKQVLNKGAEIQDEEVIRIEKKEDTFLIETAQNKWEAKYVVLASNVYLPLLESLGFEMEVNAFVPSGKIKSVEGMGVEGETSIPNLYLAGLHTSIPSQAVIVAGQGAYVGVQIATKALEKTYMWHDK